MDSSEIRTVKTNLKKVGGINLIKHIGGTKDKTKTNNILVNSEVIKDLTGKFIKRFNESNLIKFNKK